MSISNITICNDALAYLNEQNIQSLDAGGTKAESLCFQFYERCFEDVLRKTDWTFASARKEIAQLTEEPLFDYKYAYALPADCLYVRELYGGYDYRIEQGKLLANVNGTMYIRYTKKVTNYNLLDTVFQKALAYYLASTIAFPLTGQMELDQIMMQKYMVEIQQAADLDGAEEEGFEEPVSWVNARYSRGSN